MSTPPLFEYANRDALLEPGWERNAIYKWGIPLHPLGEIDAIDYVMQAQGNLQDMRARTRGVFVQLATNCIVGYLFTRNIVASISMTFKPPRTLSNWCCLLQAVSGMGYVFYMVLFTMPNGTTCRQTLWYSSSAIGLSSLCVSITLLQKAYLTHGRSKPLLFVGGIFLLPQPFSAYILFASPAFTVPSIGCLAFYPRYFPWLKFAADAPINALLSVAFIAVVHQQYRRFGSAAWAHLVRNGIQTMCAIVLANFICMFCVAFEMLGLFSEMFIAFDWILASKLLVHYCNIMGVASAKSNVQSKYPRSRKQPASRRRRWPRTFAYFSGDDTRRNRDNYMMVGY